MKMVYTATEAAEACGVSYQTIYRRMNSGLLKSYRMPGSNQRRIKRQDLLMFLKRVTDSTRPRPTARPLVLAIQLDEAALLSASRVFEGNRWFRFQAVRGKFTFEVGAQIGRWRPDLVLIDSRRRGTLGSTITSAILGDPALADCRIIHLVGPNDPDMPAGPRTRESVLKGPHTADRLLEAACDSLDWEAPVIERDYVREQAPYWRKDRRPPSSNRRPPVGGQG